MVILALLACLLGLVGLMAPPAFAQEGPTTAETSPAAASEPSPTPVPETMKFSPEAKVSNAPVQVSITPLMDGAIYYTTNGSVPSPGATPYTGPIAIDHPTVIRAQMFGADGQPQGYIYTKSFMVVDFDQTIPIVSISAEWTDLNLLHNFPTEHGKEWERPVNVEYFEPDGQQGFSVMAGLRVHGNFSRAYNIKKSYRIYFTKTYGGSGNLEYPVFEDTPVTKFDKLVLRAGFQDTFTHRGIPERADRSATAKYISDQVVRNLHRDMGQPVAHGEWVLLYLNGDFWGLYNLTERIDMQMLRTYSDKNANWDIVVKETGFEDGVWYNREEMRDGDYGAWLENQNWVGSADFTNPGNIGVLEWRIDVENVFSYLFLETYVQNTDWPSANWIAYRRSDPGAVGHEGQWRMMVWDTEDSFGGGEGGQYDLNTLVKAYSPHDSITRLLEKPFIGNCAFKHQFVDRAREYLGVENKYGKPADQVGQLSKERVEAEINKQADIVRPYIPMETARWAPDLPGPDIFEANIAAAINFVEQRQDIILHHLDILRYQTFTECK
jgi:hypothetical protein